MASTPHIVVIDPARRIPEFECFNHMALNTPVPLTYHLPALYGMQSLEAEDLSKVLGFVILGSGSSVNDREPWQEKLESWLKPLLDRGIPTLGLCYGHQMLAYMYGGTIDFAMPDQHKFTGWRKIHLESGGLWQAGSGQVVISHKEVVSKLPSSMTLLARSEDILVEGLRHKELPIYGLQSHPEAVASFLANHGIDESEPERFRFGHSLVRDFLRFAATRVS